MLTAIVFAVTATMGIIQWPIPALLDTLQRRPAGLHGQWWRIVTALVVQDGGAYGLISNLIFLAAVGAIAEQVLSRPRWMLQYLGTGLLAELVGYAWQPVGGGNSIAICGLAAAVSVTAWRHRTPLPPWAPTAVLVWCGALLASLWAPLVVLGIAGGILAGGAARNGRAVAAPMVLGMLATAVTLAIASNIHGAALLIGTALALMSRHTDHEQHRFTVGRKENVT
jgi:membrane associated rhomboid family serine protease